VRPPPINCVLTAFPSWRSTNFATTTQGDRSFSQVESTFGSIDDALTIRPRSLTVTSADETTNKYLVVAAAHLTTYELMILPGRMTATRTAHIASVEILSLKNAAHKNILALLEVYEDSSADRTFILSEYVEGVSLSTCDHYNQFTLVDATRLEKVLKDAAAGLATLHAGGVIHGNVTPATIKISTVGSTKVVDAGVRRNWTPSQPSPFDAPESQFSTAADMWALGMTLYVCLVGRFPVDTNSLEFPSGTSPLLRTAITNLLQENENDRMTASELELMVARKGEIPRRTDPNAPKFQPVLSIDPNELEHAIVIVDKVQNPRLGSTWSPL